MTSHVPIAPPLMLRQLTTLPQLLRCLILAISMMLAALPMVAIAKPAPDAVEIYRCNFGQPHDVNYDSWPDGWHRHEDALHPHYVVMELIDDPDTSAMRCLELRLDGARARISSPQILVHPKYSYQLDVKLKTEGLIRSAVVVAIDFLNERGQVLQTAHSEPQSEADDWTTVTIDPVRPNHKAIDRAVIRVETDQGVRGDLNGIVCVGEVLISRLPSMEVTTNSRFNVYDNPDDVVITCSLSGISEQNPKIRFQLLDATNRKLGKQGLAKLDGRPIDETRSEQLLRQEIHKAADIIAGTSVHREGFEGSTEWRPEISRHSQDRKCGFYQVRVEMFSSVTGESMYDRSITLAIVPPDAAERERGEFGWTLPTGDRPLPFDVLPELLEMASVSWVKIPVWYDQQNIKRGEEIIKFVEKLGAKDIETIGVIESPDPQHPRAVGEEAITDVQSLFAPDPSVWQPLFNHVMTRLSLRIRYWQLGFDHDTTFVGYDDVVEKIKLIRNQLFRFGQDVRLGLGWRWDQPPTGGELAWEFEQQSASPPLSAQQLEERLINAPHNAAQRWVLIEPVVNDPSVNTEEERHEARLRELIKQIIVAKRHGAEGIFMPNPFSGRHGVMNTDGTPGELLLPWRTAATLLSGARYLGELQLPSGSKNWLFQRKTDGQVVLVLWNDSPVQETLYLGDAPRHIDVWGEQLDYNMVEVEPGFRRQSFAVGRIPSYIIGVNEAVANWRMAVQFSQAKVPSVFDQTYTNHLELKNTFYQGVGGKAKIFVPSRLVNENSTGQERSNEWRISPDELEFSAQRGANIHQPFEIDLNEAAYGSQPIRIDFDVEANQHYRFSVWRTMEVGLGDVDIGVRTEIDENGRLIVHQRMINRTGEPMDFKCLLYAGQRRRQRAQVFQLTSDGDEKNYAYPNGRELLGVEIKLRAEEVNGSRVLIHRFYAEE